MAMSCIAGWKVNFLGLTACVGAKVLLKVLHSALAKVLQRVCTKVGPSLMLVPDQTQSSAQIRLTNKPPLLSVRRLPLLTALLDRTPTRPLFL